jgi:hypothetical protein
MCQKFSSGFSIEESFNPIMCDYKNAYISRIKCFVPLGNPLIINLNQDLNYDETDLFNYFCEKYDFIIFGKLEIININDIPPCVPIKRYRDEGTKIVYPIGN